jgi:hypothetical protein
LASSFIVRANPGRVAALAARRISLARQPGESLNWFIFGCSTRATECPGAATGSVYHAWRHHPRYRDTTKEATMSSPETHDDDNAPVPWMQQLLDNPFLLLFLGVFVPMMVYTVWGVVDILTLPMAK